MENPIALIASTLDAAAALSMSAVRSLIYFLANPTTASLVIGRNKNPVIPFVIFQSLTLFPLVVMSNLDPNEMDSLRSIVPLVESLKIADLVFAIVYFFVSYPLVNVVSYALQKNKYVFRSITRAVQNLYGFTLFILLGAVLIVLPLCRQFLVYQNEASFFEHTNLSYSVISSALTGLMIIFVWVVCYRLIRRSGTRRLNWMAAAGGSFAFLGILILALAFPAYLHFPLRHAKYMVETFKCVADGESLNVRVVLKNDLDKSVFIDRFIVFVKESGIPSNDAAEFYSTTIFKTGKEEKQERGVVVFPDERILLSFDIKLDKPDDMAGKSCALPLNPLRTQGTASAWQDILVRRSGQGSFKDQGMK